MLGFTVWELGHRLPPDFLESFARDLDAETYPYMVEHIGEHLREDNGDEVGEFEFGLDVILDGFE